MKILPGSYVKILYDLKIKEFDREISISSTKRIKQNKENASKEEEILDYQVFKIGSGELPKFFENLLLEMDVELDKEYEIEIPPEKAYGVRDPKKIEKISLKNFRKRIDQEFFVLDDGSRKPATGKIVYINFGGNLIYYGRIIRVDSRAVIVDRNHPYAGKKVFAKFKINKVILPTAPNEEKLDIILEKFFGETKQFLHANIDNNRLIISVKKDYFDRYPTITRLNAEKILSELYVPKVLLYSWGSNLYTDLGITKIVWNEEKDIVISSESESSLENKHTHESTIKEESTKEQTENQKETSNQGKREQK